MTTAQRIKGFTFENESFANNEAQVEFTGVVKVTKPIAALVAAQTGTLTTRTNNTDGVCTLDTGHGIVTGKVDVYWATGVRYGVDAVRDVNAITISGGAGDNLPTEDDPVTVVIPTAVEVNFDGDTLEIIGIIYRNAGDATAQADAAAHLTLTDAGPATIKELDLVHETENGGLDAVWNIENGDTNVFTGNRITDGTTSHDSTSAGTLYILAGITS
jgi:hypothetical protein